MAELIKRWLMVLALLVFAGCMAGKVDLLPPITQPRLDNFLVVEKPFEAVWSAAVPALGKEFFIINNLDKASGFINISYAGDPEAYIDCGRIVSYVKNARGERTYDFPGASAEQVYEVMEAPHLYFVNRKMAIDGRMNLVFEQMTPTRTRVTANVRYIITRSGQIRDVNGNARSDSHSISFNSGSGASFPAAQDGRATKCVATGKFERQVLSLIDRSERLMPSD